MTEQLQRLPGVFTIRKKDGSVSFRSSITRNGKHISLGSFDREEVASAAYREASALLSDPALTIDALPEEGSALPFAKAVSLINLRDNGLYLGAPIYLNKRDFLYYLSREDIYRFDLEDLFYYGSHRIMRRGGRLFVADYGSQVGIMSRYGIRSFAVAGRDYVFRNGDDHDLRYENIKIVNRYRGVQRRNDRGFVRYRAVIHLRGNLIIGDYASETEAAIAYNKAADILRRNGIGRRYEPNYVEGVGPAEYAEIYHRIAISDRVLAQRQSCDDSVGDGTVI